MTDQFTTNLADGILTMTLNRPEAMNALTPQMLHALYDAVTSANEDNDIRVIVLQGEGRAFSAGVDLKVLQGIRPEAGKIGDVFDDIAAKANAAIRACAVPVIAKVNGACFTGALEIALHCDFIFTQDRAKFGDTHVKWGLRPTWGMSQNLARAIGVRRARELSFSARTFTGADAAAWGLANASAPDVETLDALVQERAEQIAAASPAAVSAYKKLYRVHEELHPIEEAFAAEAALQFPEITDTAERLDGFGA